MKGKIQIGYALLSLLLLGCATTYTKAILNGPPIEAKGKLAGVIIPGRGVWFAIRGKTNYLLRSLPNIQYDLPQEDIEKKQDGTSTFTVRDYDYYVKGYLGETLETSAGVLSVINVYYLGKVEEIGGRKGPQISK